MFTWFHGELRKQRTWSTRKGKIFRCSACLNFISVRIFGGFGEGWGVVWWRWNMKKGLTQTSSTMFRKRSTTPRLLSDTPVTSALLSTSESTSCYFVERQTPPPLWYWLTRWVFCTYAKKYQCLSEHKTVIQARLWICVLKKLKL